jgi:hypothetical protein
MTVNRYDIRYKMMLPRVATFPPPVASSVYDIEPSRLVNKTNQRMPAQNEILISAARLMRLLALPLPLVLIRTFASFVSLLYWFLLT